MEADTGHLERLRDIEVESIKHWFKPGMDVLEIGGGNGYQASIIASWGCKVSSVDLADRPASPQYYYAVQAYDGEHLPFPDSTFDIVFSSNVLEHIPNLPGIFLEMRRILKPDGCAIHILPSSSWRLWTSISHYGYILAYLLGRRRPVPGLTAPPSPNIIIKNRGIVHLIKRALLAGPHGEYPNALAELYYFSITRWKCLFKRFGFEVMNISGNGLFYTGYGLVRQLSLRQRRILARFMGASGNIFVTRMLSLDSGKRGS